MLSIIFSKLENSREPLTANSWQMGTSMMKRLKELEDENQRLKKMYAEERLKAELCQEALEGKWLSHLNIARWQRMSLRPVGCGSIRLACQIFGISETCCRYQAKLGHESAVIADWLVRLTHTAQLGLWTSAQREGLSLEP